MARISAALTQPLPGWAAQKELINYNRPRPENIEEIDPEARQSAVLALLYPKNNELFTVFILRNVYEGEHSGQISFPGGKREARDKTLWHTALREAEEEVNINPHKIHKLGMLTPVYIPPSRFLVTPFLAFAKAAPVFSPDSREVQRVIEAPIALFLDKSQIAQKKIFLRSLKASVDIKYYDLEGEILWGATAMIMSEISEIFRSLHVST